MKILLTTIFLFTSILTTFSQSGRNLVAGKVMNFDKSVADAHIYNLTDNQGTITNANGYFEIYAKENDTLLISHIEYVVRKIKVTKQMENNMSLLFYMETKTNYLSTVELKNHDLSGILMNDSQNAKGRDSLFKSQNYIRELMEIGQMKSDNTELFGRSAGYVNDVDPVVMNGAGGSANINFKDKDGKLRRELRSSKTATDEIISLYGKSYFVKTLKIPEDKIYHFLTYCEYRGTLTLYRENKMIELLNVIAEESKSYLKLLEQEED